jgi:hypothetical protein
MARQSDKYCADRLPTFAFIGGYSMPTGKPTIWRKRNAIAIVSVHLLDVVAWCSAVSISVFLVVKFTVIFPPQRSAAAISRTAEARCWVYSNDAM